MGKTVVRITVRNWADIERLASGGKTGSLRAVESEALVDSGSTGFYLKASLVQQLGLRLIGEQRALTMSNRRETRRLFSPVELEIQDRTAVISVAEVPENLPNIVGQVPLEIMDWVIDPIGQKLIGNPAHGGEMLHEEF
jgi:predicted aspartyl protease